MTIKSDERIRKSYEGDPITEQSSQEFCRHCGAGIPPIIGEGTCEKCDPEGVKRHQEEVMCKEI